MYIKSLELQNFRNYKSLYLKLDKGTNILYGDNAQGKTNVLEAIYVAGTTKSHKGSKDKELIHFDEEESHIRMKIAKNVNDYQVDIHLKKINQKVLLLTEFRSKKQENYLALLILYFFRHKI